MGNEGFEGLDEIFGNWVRGIGDGICRSWLEIRFWSELEFEIKTLLSLDENLELFEYKNVWVGDIILCLWVLRVNQIEIVTLEKQWKEKKQTIDNYRLKCINKIK